MITHQHKDDAEINILIRKFEQLNLESRSATLYVHCSLNNLKSICTVKSIFSAFDYYFDKNSTLCMPGFPYNDRQFETYMSDPGVFDVNKTPAHVSLLSEVFRRKQDTFRSLHPWASVCASGKYAREITSEHHKHEDSFSVLSPFRKIVEMEGYVIGLGLDCNTNSFIHIADNELQQYANNPGFMDYYSDKDFACLDHSGNLTSVRCNVVNQTIRSKIKPRKMKSSYLETDFYREQNINDINFYSIKLKPFIRYTINQNRSLVEKNLWPSHFC